MLPGCFALGTSLNAVGEPSGERAPVTIAAGVSARNARGNHNLHMILTKLLACPCNHYIEAHDAYGCRDAHCRCLRDRSRVIDDAVALEREAIRNQWQQAAERGAPPLDAANLQR